jgi:DNA-binding transcriptional regulator/RsmH inhibitor MraZ
MYPATMDDRGRLKLASKFKEYLEQLEDKRLFVTSLDRRIAQIYPIKLWWETKKFLEDFSADPEAAENLLFNAQDLGSQAEMDGQGRVLFSPELRRELDLEDKPSHVFAVAGRLEVLSERVYGEQKQRASRNPGGDRAVLRKAGLK